LLPHVLYSLELLKFSLASCVKLGYFYQEAVNFRLITWLFDFIGGSVVDINQWSARQVASSRCYSFLLFLCISYIRWINNIKLIKETDSIIWYRIMRFCLWLPLITICNYPAILCQKLFFPLDGQNFARYRCKHCLSVFDGRQRRKAAVYCYITRAFVSRKLQFVLAD